MKNLKIKLEKDPKPQDKILYVRIRPENKRLILDCAEDLNMSASAFVDKLIDELRTQNDLLCK
jgi:hypothetical protein